MRTLIKIVVGLVVVVAVGIGAVFFFTAGIVKTADQFFTAAREMDMDKAYSYLSEDFKAATSTEDLKEYLIENSLSDYKEASWQSRSISGGRGELIGSITTRDGGVVPVKLGFVKGGDGWKIYSLQKPKSGIQQEEVERKVPSENEQIELVADSMRVFADSVNERSMAKFYGNVSKLMQRQYTVEEFDEAYGNLFEVEGDFRDLDNYSPVFKKKPLVDEDGILVVSGYYPTQPQQVHFEHKYIYEGMGWKLLGFGVTVE